MRKTFAERRAEGEVISRRIKGAALFQHKTRGWVWMLHDGTYVSLDEYKALVLKSVWMFTR